MTEVGDVGEEAHAAMRSGVHGEGNRATTCPFRGGEWSDQTAREASDLDGA